MKKSLIWSIFILIVSSATSGYSQCSGETYSVVNQCPNQSPQLSVSPVTAGTDYIWTVGGSVYGTGNDFTYQAPLTGATTISYQKVVSQTGGPSKGAATTYTLPAGTTTVTNNYSVSVNSTTPFRLNNITVPIKLNYCDPGKTYRIKVIVGPLATPTSASTWYTFNCGNLISTSDNQTFLVPVKVNTSPTVPGLDIAAGPTTISAIYDDPATNPAGTSPLDGLVAFSTTTFNNSYTLGTTTITHSSTTNRPAFLDWNITTLCPKVDIPLTPTSSPSCCVPGNVNAPSITTSTGSSIIDTDPVSPALKLTTPLQSGFYYQWFKNGQAIAAPTQNANSLNITTSGQYSVRVVEKLADINKMSCYKSDLEMISKRILFAQADKTTLCLGESTKLNALGATGTTAGSIVWSGGSVISNVNIKSPVFVPSTTGTFSLEVDAEVPVGNQVINGDFELFTVGDASPGFTYSPYYHFVDPATAVTGTDANTFFGIPGRKGVNWLQNGNFSLYNYVFSNNDGYTGIKPCPDHTTGTGNLLFTDAASKNIPAGTPLTDSYIWAQQVSLQAGQVYEFAAWFTNANTEYCACTDPFDKSVNTPKSPSGQPQVNLYVDNVLVNPTPISITGATCQWQKVSYLYTAPFSGTATIKIVEISRADQGNDFAFDDISFGSPGRQKSTIDIIVNDCDDYDAKITCGNPTVTLDATSSNGFFSKWTHTSSSAVTDASTIADPTKANTTATPTANTQKYTAEFKFVRGNVIPNPDYSATSNNGTTLSDRTNQAGAYGLNSEYIIGKNPATYSNTQDKIYVAVPDHTTGSATSFDYFSASGNYTAGKNVVFSQTLTTTSGSEYGFSVWLANIHSEFTKATPDTSETSPYGVGAKTTKLDLYVGGVFVKRFQLPLNTSWNNFGYSFKATGSSTTVELRIPNITSNKPSAFAMDDISLGGVDTKKKDVLQNCPLPVTYLYINLSTSNGLIDLSWATINEKNSAYFIIEKSTDGVHFITSGKVNAQGTKYDVTNYRFTEPESVNYNYYRIKQVDLDGKFEYSNILATLIGSSELSIIVYPNPSTGSFLVKINAIEGDDIVAKITDSKGSLVTTYKVNSGSELLEVGHELLPGLYFLEVSDSKKVSRKRLVKL